LEAFTFTGLMPSSASDSAAYAEQGAIRVGIDRPGKRYGLVAPVLGEAHLARSLFCQRVNRACKDNSKRNARLAFSIGAPRDHGISPGCQFVSQLPEQRTFGNTEVQP
jgi:hypothetical protein